ncbi:MAG: histidine kinase [Micrococcus sp.]|nr:histidine kinase [Micrococcus sp.]
MVGVLLVSLELVLVTVDTPAGESVLGALAGDSLGVLLFGIALLATPAGLVAMAACSVLATIVAAPTDSSIVSVLLVPWIAFLAGRHLRTRALVFFFVGHLFASGVSAALHPEVWLTLLVTVPGLTAGVTVGLFTRRLGVLAHEAQEASIKAYEQQDRAIADLRRSMARDLHDVVAQNLSVIALQAEGSRYLSDRTEQSKVLATVASTARQTHTDLRGLLDVLYASTGSSPPERSAQEDLATVSAMSLVRGARGAVARLQDQGFLVDQSIDLPDEAEVPRSVQTTMDRILQEACANVVRHAPTGANVSLDVRVTGGQLGLHIANDVSAEVRSKPELASGAYGLLNIGERAHLLGGRADIGPHDGRWHVRVTLPLRH